MSVQKGDKAIEFKLSPKPREEIDLAQHIGKDKIVLLFFPLAYSSVCTEEMCKMREEWKQYETLGAKVFGISVDSPFVTDKFRIDEKLPFPILSDFNKDVSRKYGVLHEDLMGLKGVSKRSAFVIGKDGKVNYAWVTDDPKVMPNFDEIKAALK